ncbi:hypothetical protein ACFU51_36090, partial [Streptomyces sp. NPDC057430]|uniref:hypothetical protein n=1 Tax=Streptomyces sp. NPDC057430 TaxID=3346131 RepID=UPI0036CDD9F7
MGRGQTASASPDSGRSPSSRSRFAVRLVRAGLARALFGRAYAAPGVLSPGDRGRRPHPRAG